MSPEPSDDIDANVAPFGCCIEPALPPGLALEAAWDAATARPANAPLLVDAAYGHDHGSPLPPEAITFLMGKFWPVGATIRVAFIGGSPRVNAKVMHYASLWSQYANVDFAMARPRGPCDIRVGYGLEGYWSYLGTDCAALARAGAQTLNLQGFDRYPMPESEWSRVVCHEFGHALGAVHEQMRPEAVARLDPEKCYAYFGRTQGWDRAMVDAQVLTPLDMAGVVAGPEDDASIMMYAFPAAVTTDGRPIAGGVRINALDAATIGRIYPGRGVLHPTMVAMLGSPPAGLAGLA